MYDNKYLTSAHWKIKRFEAIQSKGNKCEVCGRTLNPNEIQVHHKTYENLWNENIDDLEILCRQCHMNKHHKLTPKGFILKYIKNANDEQIIKIAEFIKEM